VCCLYVRCIGIGMMFLSFVCLFVCFLIELTFSLQRGRRSRACPDAAFEVAPGGVRRRLLAETRSAKLHAKAACVLQERGMSFFTVAVVVSHFLFCFRSRRLL
jgi:hypothetical protein